VDIAKVVDLTGASVTRLTRQLSDRGLVFETALREARPGQPARPLRLMADGAYGIGLNFSHATIEVGLVDLTGAMLEVVSGPIDIPTFESISSEARRIIEAMLTRHRVKRDRVVGIGVSVPGYRSKTPGHFAIHPDFPNFLFRNLARDLETYLGAPTIVERDAISAAIGESLVGGGRDRLSFAFIHLGHGIGGAMIVEGQPFHGAHGNAGGIGVLFPRGVLPRPSGEDLLGHLRENGIEMGDFEDLKALDIEDCVPLRLWIDQAAAQLRTGMSIIWRLFDPTAIVLGGRMPTSICEALVSRIGELDRPGYTDDLPQPALLSSSLGPRSGVRGAACLPLFETFFSQRPVSPRSSLSDGSRESDLDGLA